MCGQSLGAVPQRNDPAGEERCFPNLNVPGSLAVLLQCTFVVSRSGLEPQVLHLELTQKG